MSLDVHRRPNDVFLSHAHVDRAFVDKLYYWLDEVANLDVWYDAKKMAGGTPVGLGLQQAIKQCRGIMLVASPTAIMRGWVKSEVNIALDEQAQSSDFRIVPLRLSNADVGDLVSAVSWIDVPDPELTPGVAAQIIRSFYPGDKRPDPRTSRDVYVSASWDTDNSSALAVSKTLVTGGLRLIGDAKDQPKFDPKRVQSIIESCGAFVGVIPYRDNSPSASATEKPYKYFLTELDLAVKADLPTVVIADPRVRRTDGDDSGWLRMDTQAAECPGDVRNALQDVWNRWKQPTAPHYIFFATDLESPCALRNSDFRELVERITGLRTVVGNELDDTDLQQAIINSVRQARFVIADISGANDQSFNLNACIEAGIALAFGVKVALLAKGKPRSLPFMLRSGGQLKSYADEIEQLFRIHSIIQSERRRVINAEL